MRAKKMGVVAGYPDLALFVPVEAACALFIELKDKGRKPMARQKAMHAMLEAQGYAVAVCDTAEAFRIAVTRYLNNG